MLGGMKLALVRSRRNVLVAALFLVLGGVAAHGQRPPQGGGATTPLLIDFTAVTADGKPVADLTAADLAIKIGGKARTVSSLELKKIEAPAAAAAPAAGAPAPSAGDITPPFFTNDAKAAAAPSALGRAFLIVVDTESLPAASDSAVKAAIEGVLKGLTDADRVGFSTAPRDTAQVGFGTGLGRVRQAVTAMQGQKAATVTAAVGLCRTAQTLAELSSLVQALAANPTPTSVIFIAGSLSMPDKATGDTGVCEVLQSQYQTVADAAAEARANVYVVQGDPGVMGSDNGLATLASVTGARSRHAHDGRWFCAARAGRVLDLLGGDHRAGPGRSAGPGAAARSKGQPRWRDDSRPRVCGGVARGARRGGAAAAAKPGAASPKDMISSPAQFTDLQLRATAIVQRGAQDKFNILIQAEPVDPAVKITAMRVGYFDQSNKGASLDSPKATTYPITDGFCRGAGPVPRPRGGDR